MISELSLEEQVVRIERTILSIGMYSPPVRVILEAFKDVFIEKARLKVEFPQSVSISTPSLDTFRFSQGVPLLTEDSIISFTDAWSEVIERMMTALGKGFPKIKPELNRLKMTMEAHQLDFVRCTKAILRGRDEEIEQTAFDLKTNPLILRFILELLLKPFIEQWAENAKILIENLYWTKGYCPICGSFPELVFVKEKEVPRWLRCSICGYEWLCITFACPYCGNGDCNQLEFYFVQEREYERAEICYKCRRYLLSIDFRKNLIELVPEVAALGLVFLEILVQQKGFLPVAFNARNIVLLGDTTSSPIYLL